MRIIRLFSFMVGIIAFWSLLPIAANAQIGTQATINGTVTDSSGAVIPGACVVVVENSLHLQREINSDAQGNFQILALPIGTYTATVSANGMKTWKVEDLHLTIGAIQKISPVLAVGAISQVVTVHSQQELQILQELGLLSVLARSVKMNSVPDREMSKDQVLKEQEIQKRLTMSGALLHLLIEESACANRWRCSGRRDAVGHAYGFLEASL